MAPDFSTDIFRYIFEGRVVWHKGISFPYLVAPSAAIETGLPKHLVDESFRQINHPNIPAIYPPIAQLVFVLAGGISEGLRCFGIKVTAAFDLMIIKFFLLCCEIVAYALVALAIKYWNQSNNNNRPVSYAWICLIALCPIAVIEISREGHADSVAMLGLALAILGFSSRKLFYGHLGFAVASLAKLNGIIGLIIGLRFSRKHSGSAILLLVTLGLPYLILSLDSDRGLSEYATRWRSFDGFFAVLLQCSEVLLGGDWKRLGTWTITKHQLARTACGMLYLGFLGFRLRKRPSSHEVVALSGECLLVLLLVTPSLHPWYLTWLLPFVPFMQHGKAASIWLLCLSPLIHHASFSLVAFGSWDEPLWLRCVIHIPAWIFLMVSWKYSRATERDPSDQLQR